MVFHIDILIIGIADKYVHVSQTSFPELSVCPSLPYKEHILMKNGITSREDIRWEAKWISNDSSLSAQKFYEKVGELRISIISKIDLFKNGFQFLVYTINETIQEVNIITEREVNSQHSIKFKPLDKLCNGSNPFVVRPYYYNGNCYRYVTMMKLDSFHARQVLT